MPRKTRRHKLRLRANALALRRPRLQLLICSLFLFASCAQRDDSSLDEFLKNKQAAVIVFLAPDCPVSQSYTRTLNELRARFLGDGIELYGVFPGAADFDDFVKTYQITFPVLGDPDFRLADHFDAMTTPEVFVVDRAGEVIYKGAIDNGAPALGVRRTVITEHYLADALGSFLRGEEIHVKDTPAVGCFIERVL
jgi:peroxiredoxin